MLLYVQHTVNAFCERNEYLGCIGELSSLSYVPREKLSDQIKSDDKRTYANRKFNEKMQMDLYRSPDNHQRTFSP